MNTYICIYIYIQICTHVTKLVATGGQHYIYIHVHKYIHVYIWIRISIYSWNKIRTHWWPTNGYLDWWRRCHCVHPPCNTWALQCVAACCSVLQRVAVCRSVFQCVQCVAMRCSVVQCVAVCRSVSQCVAVCHSVLQWVLCHPPCSICVWFGLGAKL